nr:MAG TPA: hypothetical protein [Bacteriophage sp.]
MYHNFKRLSRGFSNFFDCHYSPFQNRFSLCMLYYSTFKILCQALFFFTFQGALPFFLYLL